MCEHQEKPAYKRRKRCSDAITFEPRKRVRRKEDFWVLCFAIACRDRPVGDAKGATAPLLFLVSARGKRGSLLKLFVRRRAWGWRGVALV